MSAQHEPDYGMMAMFWDDWDGVSVEEVKAMRTQVQTVDEAAERVADFEQAINSADADAIENDRTAMGPKGRLNRGQFGTRAAAMFDWPSAMDVRDAVQCTLDDARTNSDVYQLLQRIRQERPELYLIITARISWDLGTKPNNAGPFANNWGE